jgi:hypothetical protein
MAGIRNELFLLQPIVVEGDLPRSLVWDIDHDPQPTRFSVWCARLLIHLFREAIEHGDWQRPIRLQSSVSSSLWTLRTENFVGNRDKKKHHIRTLLDPLTNVDTFISTLGNGLVCESGRGPVGDQRDTDGKNVLEFIASQIHAEARCERAPNDTDPFWAKVVFSLPSVPGPHGATQ